VSVRFPRSANDDDNDDVDDDDDDDDYDYDYDDTWAKDDSKNSLRSFPCTRASKFRIVVDIFLWCRKTQGSRRVQ
jgi:hypothetical protein